MRQNITDISYSSLAIKWFFGRFNVNDQAPIDKFVSRIR